MKKLRVQIYAYQYHADFIIESEDSVEAVEKAISVSAHHPDFEKHEKNADNAEKALDDYMVVNGILYEDADIGKVV